MKKRLTCHLLLMKDENLAASPVPWSWDTFVALRRRMGRRREDLCGRASGPLPVGEMFSCSGGDRPGSFHRRPWRRSGLGRGFPRWHGGCIAVPTEESSHENTYRL